MTEPSDPPGAPAPSYGRGDGRASIAEAENPASDRSDADPSQAQMQVAGGERGFTARRLTPGEGLTGRLLAAAGAAALLGAALAAAIGLWSAAAPGPSLGEQAFERALREAQAHARDRAGSPTARDRADSPTARDRAESPNARDRADAQTARDRADSQTAQDRVDPPSAREVKPETGASAPKPSASAGAPEPWTSNWRPDPEEPGGAPAAAPPPSPAWIRYAAPAPEPGDRALLAIVIDDVGLAVAETERVLALDPAITIAVLPHAEAAADIVARARARGGEALAHVPMRPKGDENPGPDPIEPRAPKAETLRRLERHLSGMEGVVGVNNHMGSAATASAVAMAPLMARLGERGLAFLDSRTATDSVAAAEAARAGLPHAANDLFLDDPLEPGAIRRKLRLAERLALKRGAAIAIGHPHPETLRALEAWLATRDADRIALVPLTAILRRRLESRAAPAP